ncbi:ENV1 protein, partial [Tricholaema leucomelas]|nr:ENV1 protein [Tricholaema leucomelas]
NTLWKIIQASYQVLNKTHPNLTEHCCLCYGIETPYYEAIGVDLRAERQNGSNPAQCQWKHDREPGWGLTMAQVTGRGRCIG